MKQWPIFSAVLVLLLAFAACEGESPTEPTRGGGGPGGSTTPPTNASITLAVSNPQPLVGSTSTITATVTQGSQPVANGTAVEFSTNLGAFTDTSSNSTIRTTTGGVSAAVLTSSAAGTASVTVRVNNASAVAQVVFVSQPTIPPPLDTAPAITSISPAQGKPSGGDLVTINGRNFEPPLRVLFGETPATIVSSTTTEIRVITPPVQLGVSEQAREVTITVITKAGSAGEARATGGPFRYQLEILTPTVFHISPASGSNDGNTRITIFGEGFQSPCKVFFGTGAGTAGGLTNQVEVNVEQVTFGQIIAMTPPATGMGAALANQQVTVRVMNIGSNAAFTLPGAFRYGPEMRITAVGPTTGSAFESTRVTIEGWGFDDQKVAVTVGGIAAQPIFVSGTKIIVQTGLPSVNSCGDISGPISVTNIEDGTSATAEGLSFTYRVPQPAIISVSPAQVGPGSSVTVTVVGAGPGPARISFGDVAGTITNAAFAGLDGTYTVVVPTVLLSELTTESCAAGGSRPLATTFDVKFENVQSGCTDTFTKGITLTPPATPRLFVTPQSLAFPQLTLPNSATQTATLVNTGNATLTITAITTTGTTEFSVPLVAIPPLEPCQSQVIAVSYSPTDANTDVGSVSITSNGGPGAISLTGSAVAPPPPAP